MLNASQSDQQVIVPANLRQQYPKALDYFFHIPARVISARHRREMEHELPVALFGESK